MHIYFVKPGDRDWISYPYQYAALSAYVKREGHQAGFYDASLGSESPEKAMEKCGLKAGDILAISIYTASQDWVRSFIALARSKYPGMKVVVGGPHISALGALAMEHVGADIGVVGEGELPFAELLKRMDGNSGFDGIPGLIWKEGAAWKDTLNLPMLRVKNLDDLPMPDFEAIDPRKYFDVFRGASVARRHNECAVIFSSRGCPYNCTYCATNCTWQRRITGFSAQRVVEEMELLKNKYGIREIWVDDDTFTYSRKRTIDICTMMIEKKLDLDWRLPNGIRLDSVDEELASWMSRAGCYMAGVGVETGSESAMKMIKKNLDLKIVGDKLRILKKYGILVSGFFIFGMPWETREQVEETARFILEKPFDRMQISVFNPYPGSEEFDNIMEKSDPQKYAANVRQYLYEEKIAPFLKHLDLQYLYDKSKKIYRKFYMKPRVMWSVIRNLTFQQIRDILRHPMIQAMFKKKHTEEDTYIKLHN
jgi:radical SAM superfamily enzyme YgiQ (UPF0313 family)